jgi:hypothetical protein
LKRAGSNEELRGDVITRAGISGVIGTRWETTLTGGSHLSAGEREKGAVLVRDSLLGRGCLRYWAGFAPVALFLYFSSFLLFFLFLVYFVSFSFVLQFDSNQFVKFSKIQDNIPEQ